MNVNTTGLYGLIQLRFKLTNGLWAVGLNGPGPSPIKLSPKQLTATELAKLLALHQTSHAGL